MLRRSTRGCSTCRIQQLWPRMRQFSTCLLLDQAWQWHNDAKKVPLSSLRPFEAAARHGSFVRTAVELGLTASGYQPACASTGELLNVPLFVRHRRAVMLTPAGREFAMAVRGVLEHIETAAQEVSLSARDWPVSIACIPSIATRCLIPRPIESRGLSTGGAYKA